MLKMTISFHTQTLKFCLPNPHKRVHCPIAEINHLEFQIHRYIFFIRYILYYISNVDPFLGFFPPNPITLLPYSYVQSLLCPGIPLHCNIQPFQDQWPLLPLMSTRTCSAAYMSGATGNSMFTL